MTWCVAIVHVGHELAAAHKVNREDSRSFCLLTPRRWVARGQKHERLVPILSGYVFVEMDPTDSRRWHEVAACKGFGSFIGGAVPMPANQKQVDMILARCEVRVDQDTGCLDMVVDLGHGELSSSYLGRGAIVKIVDGYLDNCLGVVEWTRRRPDGLVAQVTTRGFFGIDMRVEVPVECLERVGDKRSARRSLVDLPVQRAVV